MRVNTKDCDFSGWATKNGVLCTDGRVIMRDAFKSCDGKDVPLVWNHGHDSPFNVLGKAVLENRPEGVYAYGFFNDTEAGRTAKNIVMHGDITALSICANHVTEQNGNVQKGNIKEVSLVHSGANHDAVIDTVIRHSDDGSSDTEAFISFGERYCLFHVDTDKDDKDEEEDEPKEKDNSDKEDSDDDDLNSVLDQLSDEDREKLMKMINSRLGKNSKSDVKHSDEDDTQEEESADEEDDGMDIEGVLETLTDEQTETLYAGLEDLLDNEDVVEHADDDSPFYRLVEMYDDLNDAQKEVISYLVGYTSENRDELNEEIAHAGDTEDETFEGDDNVKKSPFRDNSGTPAQNANEFTQADIQAIFTEAVDSNAHSLRRVMKKYAEENGKGTIFMHGDDDPAPAAPVVNYAPVSTNTIQPTAPATLTYGVYPVDMLFPDAHEMYTRPEFIKREMDWVTKVYARATHTPFSRIRTTFANITEDEARAKGYIKGNEKTEEFFTLLRRTTVPTTIYKKQKLDRDDITDITSFDVVGWIKSEMRMMLDEEISRAVLIGDGRSTSSEDHINEANVRPILTDEDLYTVKRRINPGADDAETASALIDDIIRSRKYYKGSGNPTLFTTEDQVTEMLLLKDNIGRRLYNNVGDLKTLLRVDDIVTVPVMENQTTAQGDTVAGILLNMKDYAIGADKGGAVNMFDDFDIDFNQYKYLIETRISGALIKPYAAIAYTIKAA